MAREAICTRNKDGLNSENVGVKDSTRDLSSHVYVESWRDRVRVPQLDSTTSSYSPIPKANTSTPNRSRSVLVGFVPYHISHALSFINGRECC